MHINSLSLPWTLDKRLIQILNDELESAGIDDDVCLTFNDPDFTPQAGGFHPVEVAVKNDGSIMYITDFTYFGEPPHCDLCKCLDFDFSLKIFNHFGMEHPISAGREIFKVWQSNFIAYHKLNVYKTILETW